ncbi:alkyl sulfatase dimerization domain-containing protein [Acidithrix ferrooxidans]|uniref:alkyl sulfatase dimerization domain-containing protein n=1 Tax=Acidithrix ferrooxidans TaxID=1280514 RepID=UPI0006991DB0|nr:alkyl sulfatase dimerization domain-containing protein [Acidithrix ferrooxidans]
MSISQPSLQLGLSHNSKAVYQKYLGFFDGNPTNLNPLPPSEAGEAYVEYMGGAAALLERVQRDYGLGKYRRVSQAFTHLVFSEPENIAARQLLASTYEQLAYQAESGPWRNFYLCGALELGSEVSFVLTARIGANFEVLSSMSIDMSFDLFGVRLNGPNARGAIWL